MNTRTIAILLGAAALAVPAAAGAETEHKPPGKETEKRKGEHKRAKKVTFVFKGEFIEPGLVEVFWGNSHVRRGGFLGETVEFDLERAKIVVADTNGDGRRDVADVADGDRVLVIARLHKRTKYVAPVEDEAPEAEAAGGEVTEESDTIVARKLIDRSNHPRDEDEDVEPAHAE